MEPHPRTARLPGTASSSGTGADAGSDAGHAPVDPSVAGTLLGGRYRIGKHIGTGAMGVVWTAWDQRLRRTVAVKQLVGSAAQHADPSDPAPARVRRARTLREGRIAARVIHPRAIAVFDVVIPPGEYSAPWLVMEYLPSRSLAAVLAEHGPLEPGQVAAVGAQIADALAAVHAAGIVHGDVKPGNVLISDDGSGVVAKLTDFGVSRASWDTTATGGGMVAGTPGYVAPEVARGEDPTAASDVFSLGATLYAAVEGTLVCGALPNHLAVLHAMAEGRLRPATRAGSMGRPLAAMLRVTAEHRPDMSGVRGALRERATDTPIPAAGTPRTEVADGAPERPEVAEADVAEPEHMVSGSAVSGSAVAGFAVSGPAVAGSAVAETAAPGSAVPEPAVSGSAVSGSAVSGSAVSGSAVAGSAVPGPRADQDVPEAIAARAVPPRPDLGEPTRLSEPVDVPAPRRADGSDAEDRRRADRERRPGGGGRVLLVAGAAALALGLGAGVTVAGHSVLARTSDSTRHAAAAPQPGAQPGPAGPPPAVIAPAPSSQQAGGTAPGTDEVGRTVADYYGALPADVDTAWSALSTQAREESGGYDGYTRFWRSIRTVSADDVQVDGTAATAQITFVTVDGRTSHESYRFRVGRGDDGRPLIESARRASSPM